MMYNHHPRTHIYHHRNKIRILENITSMHLGKYVIVAQGKESGLDTIVDPSSPARDKPPKTLPAFPNLKYNGRTIFISWKKFQLVVLVLIIVPSKGHQE